MDSYSRLEHTYTGQVLVVRPAVRVLGPWDGNEPPPVEATEFRDQLWHLLNTVPAPLLLDLRGFESARNWDWLLVPLARDCRARGRPLVACAGRAVAEQFALAKLDRVLPVRPTVEEAVALLTAGAAESEAAPDPAT